MLVAEHGAAHVLVNNAGVTSAGAFEKETLEDLRWIVGINVWGVVHGCHAFLPLLKAQDEAHVVNVSSMVGLVGLPHNAAYALTKGAVRSFSEALRAELDEEATRDLPPELRAAAVEALLAMKRNLLAAGSLPGEAA